MKALRTISALVLAGVITLHAADWPNYRGPKQDGSTPESAAPVPWPKEGPKVLWKARVGTGPAGMSVSGERLYTLGYREGSETVVCLSTSDGKVLWSHSYAAELLDTMHEGGPASTPTVSGDTVYSLSRDGQFFALNAADGKVRWTVNLQKEFKAKVPFFGFTFSPLIVDGKVILPIGKSGSSSIALNAADGTVLWQKGADPAAYASPILYSDGKSATILNGGALILQNLADGAELARYPFENQSPMNSYVNAATPLFHANGYFITAEYGMGSARVDVKNEDGKLALKEAWKSDAVSMQYSSPVLLNDHIFGFHSFDQGDSAGEFICMEWATGKVLWHQKNPGRGMVVSAAGKLLILSRNGELILAEPDTTKFTSIARVQVTGSTCRNDPIVANGKIYVRAVNGELICLDVTGK